MTSLDQMAHEAWEDSRGAMQMFAYVTLAMTVVWGAIAIYIWRLLQ